MISMMKKNFGLTRIDGHRSHIKGSKRSTKFLQKIGFKEFEDNRLKDWFKRYKNGRK